ncbi:hypothetical protein Ndes2437B_g06732 [Nannochloris sp. 'desiccata']
MAIFQGVQRRLQSTFSLHRRKTVAKWCLKRYSNAKTLGNASIHKLGMVYTYMSYKVATDESARTILAASLLVILFSLVALVFVKRRRSKQSQTQRQKQQKEGITGLKSDITAPVTPFKPILKASLTPNTQESMGPQTRLATLKNTLTATQTELADLKTTVTDLIVSKIQFQASSTAAVAALKAEVEELTAKIDSIEIDAGQTASQQTVIDSLSQGLTRLERSSQALLAWRAQVAAYDLAHPAAAQSELDKVSAEVAACYSLFESVRDAQEKLSSSFQSKFSTAIKDLMQSMADGRKGAITRGVRCSTGHGGSESPGTSGSTGSLVLQGVEAFSTERTGACLE